VLAIVGYAHRRWHSFSAPEFHFHFFQPPLGFNSLNFDFPLKSKNFKLCPRFHNFKSHFEDSDVYLEFLALKTLYNGFCMLLSLLATSYAPGSLEERRGRPKLSASIFHKNPHSHFPTFTFTLISSTILGRRWRFQKLRSRLHLRFCEASTTKASFTNPLRPVAKHIATVERQLQKHFSISIPKLSNKLN
jgi:hypothetical protein